MNKIGNYRGITLALKKSGIYDDIVFACKNGIRTSEVISMMESHGLKYAFSSISHWRTQNKIAARVGALNTVQGRCGIEVALKKVGKLEEGLKAAMDVNIPSLKLAKAILHETGLYFQVNTVTQWRRRMGVQMPHGGVRNPCNGAVKNKKVA